MRRRRLHQLHSAIRTHGCLDAISNEAAKPSINCLTPFEVLRVVVGD